VEAVSSDPCGDLHSDNLFAALFFREGTMKTMIDLFREYVQQAEEEGGERDVVLNLIFSKHLLEEIDALLLKASGK
jgi:hypothetical protein